MSKLPLQDAHINAVHPLCCTTRAKLRAHTMACDDGGVDIVVSHLGAGGKHVKCVTAVMGTYTYLLNRIHVGAALQQQLHNFRVAVGSCEYQRRASVLPHTKRRASCARTMACGDGGVGSSSELLGKLGADGRQAKYVAAVMCYTWILSSAHTHLLSRVHVGAALQQQLHNFRVAVGSCEHQRRASVLPHSSVFR